MRAACSHATAHMHTQFPRLAQDNLQEASPEFAGLAILRPRQVCIEGIGGYDSDPSSHQAAHLGPVSHTPRARRLATAAED